MRHSALGVAGLALLAAVVGASHLESVRGPRGLRGVDSRTRAARVAAAQPAKGSGDRTPAAEAGLPPNPTVASGDVRVTVLDFAGRPLPNARVVARAVAPDPSFWSWIEFEQQRTGPPWLALPPWWDLTSRAGATTAEDGTALLRSVPAGPCRIDAELPGRVRRSVTCEVAARAPVSVELRAEKGHPLAGRVLAEDGTPVAGAVVAASYPAVVPPRRSAEAPRVAKDHALERTDADGRFRFDALPATVVSLSCGPPGGWSSHAWRVHVPGVSELDLHMVSREIEGLVFDADGRSVAGADVALGVGGWHTAQVTSVARTGKDGRYRIPLHPHRGVTDIRVRVGDRECEARVLGGNQPPFQLPADETAVIDLSVAGLKEAVDGSSAIRGSVRGPDGPVAGAHVFLSRLDDELDEADPAENPEMRPWSSPTVTTDAEGRFVIPGAPSRRFAVLVEPVAGLFQPGAAAIFAGATSLPDASGPAVVEPDAPRPAEVAILLTRGGRVSGRVVDEAKRPVAGAKVQTRGGVSGVSRDDGTFVLEGLDEPAEGTVWGWSADGERDGESEKWEGGAGKDVAGVVVTVRPTSSASLRQTIAVTGSLHLPADRPVVEGARIESWNGWVPLPQSGPFRVDVPIRVSDGAAEMTVVVPGVGRSEVRIEDAEAADEFVLGPVALTRAREVRGRVFGGDVPLAGVPIRVEPRTDSLVISCGPFEDAEPPIAAVSGPDGSFVASDLPEGRLRLTVRVPGSLKLETFLDDGPIEGPPLELRLRRDAVIVGRVVRKDGRVPKAWLSAWPEEQAAAEVWKRDSAVALAREDGSFELVVAAGRRYRIDVTPASGGAADANSTFLRLTSGPHEPGGEPLVLTVEDGASISGRVLDAGGAAIAGATVTCRAPEDRDERTLRTESDAEGRFSFGALVGGPFSIAVLRGLEAPVVAPETEAGRAEVVVRLPEPGVVEGTLLDESGSPAAQRVVVATAMSGDDARKVRGRTDGAGRFRIVGAGTAPVRIELERGPGGLSSGSAWPLVGGVPVSPGTRELSLRIPTAAATTVAGRCLDDAGAPFTQIEIQVLTGRDESVEHYRAPGGATFEFAGRRLDAPCRLVACVAGIRWLLDVPAGTTDVEFRAGRDGLHSVSFGGRKLDALPVRLAFGQDLQITLMDGKVRLVHAVTGAVVEVPRRGPRNGFTVPDRGENYRADEVPVGPWRVEIRGSGSGDEWRACSVVRERGDMVLVR